MKPMIFPGALRIARRLGAAAIATATLSLGGVATAQDGWVSPDILELRQRMDALTQQVDALSVSGGVGVGGAGGDPTRIGRLENELRRLIGEFERLNFQAQQTQRALDAKLAEVEFRLTRLEGGDPTPPPAVSGAPISGAPISGAAVAGVGAGQTLEPLQPQSLPVPPQGVPVQPQGVPVAAGAAPGTLGEINAIDGPQASATPVYDTPPAPAGAQDPYAGYEAAGAAAGGVVVGAVSFEDALLSVQQGDNAAAEAKLQAFIAQNPTDPRVGEATYWLGETYRVRGRYQEAVKIYASGLKQHPQSSKAPDSYLSLGISLAQLNQTDKACQVLAQIEARFPDASQRTLRRAAIEGQRAGCR